MLYLLNLGPEPTAKQEKYNKINHNPQIVDLYFSMRLDLFLETFFDKILDCEWRWHRYEWQSRLAIHAHGAARFRNDPGLTKLTLQVYAGRKAQELLSKNDTSIENYEEIQNLIKLGVESEQRIINYTDTLTAMNDNKIRTNEIPDPHPCSINITLVDPDKKDDDYFNLINFCQRHVCRLDGYCKSNKQSNKGKKIRNTV